MSTLLVDADVVAYQVAFSTEEPIRWGQEEEFAIWTLHSCLLYTSDAADE